MQADTVYESVALEDAFGDDRTNQADVVQGNGTGGNLYIKTLAAGAGIRETFLKFSLEPLDAVEPSRLADLSVELSVYTHRTNGDAAQNEVGVYPVADTTWRETSLTWNNSRTLSASAREAGEIASGGGVRIAGYSGSGQQGAATDAYNEANVSRFNVGDYVRQQYRSGNKIIALLLRVKNSVNNGDQQLISKDASPDIPGYALKVPKLIFTLSGGENAIQQLQAGTLSYTYEPNGTIRTSEPVSRIAIYTVQGQEALSKANTDRLDASALPPGLYIVRLTGRQGETLTGKILGF
jgi:hypothetical protein